MNQAPRTAARLTAMALLGALALGRLPARGEEPAEPEGWQPYAGTLPHVETDRACLLIRDARTGAAIRWALVENRLDFVGPEAWGPVEQSASADEHGVALLPAAQPGINVWVVRAPGYAAGQPQGLGAFQDVVDVEPAPAVHGRIVDVRGRPVAGALVEWTDHRERQGPSLGRATTDAGGVFRMCVPLERADVTLVGGPGVANEFWVRAGPVWADPPVWVAEPGRELVGRVRLPPARLRWPRSLVAANGVRGALGPIDDTGGFRFSGVLPDESTVYLHGYAPPAGGAPPWLERRGPELDPTDWTPGRFIDWDPEEQPDGPQEPTRTVTMVLLGPEEARLGFRLRLDRLEDGRRFELRTWEFDGGPNGSVGTIALAPGTYVVAPDEAFAPWRPRPTLLHVPAPGAGTPLPFVILPESQPRLVIEGPLGEDDAAWVWASTPFGDRAEPLDTDTRTLSGARVVHVPAEAEVGILVRGPSGVTTARAGPLVDGRRHLRIDPPKPAILSLPDLWPGQDLDDLRSTAGWVSRPVRRVGTRIEVSVPGGRRIGLEGWAIEGMASLPMWALDVPAAGERLEVTPEQLLGPRLRTLVLRLPAGSPQPVPTARIWSPHIVRSDLDHAGWAVAEVAADAAGGSLVRSRALCAGALVTLDLEDRSDKTLPSRDVRWLPLRLACAGEGPYTLIAPRSGLDLTIDAGDAAAVACLVDGDLLDLGTPAKDAPLVRRLRGLPPGPHALIVAARGRESRLLRFTLATDEVRALEVALPRRP
jgi:hypothetical protein